MHVVPKGIDAYNVKYATSAIPNSVIIPDVKSVETTVQNVPSIENESSNNVYDENPIDLGHSSVNVLADSIVDTNTNSFSNSVSKSIIDDKAQDGQSTKSINNNNQNKNKVSKSQGYGIYGVIGLILVLLCGTVIIKKRS